MKSCPFCKAVLSDEANFCLYCMTSLDKKQKSAAIEKKKSKVLPALLFLSVILSAVIIAFSVISRQNDTSTEEPTVDDEEVPVQESSEYPEISYIYRTAGIGDDYSSAVYIYENDIVIIGIEKAEASGIYYVPDTIDGKRVIAIDSLAFSDENIAESVKKVIISDSVRTIWEHAFAGCVNMSGIFLMGDSIHIDVNAFSQSRNAELKICCSDICDDRNFRYYKNNAAAYGAVYEYWDGGAAD